MKKKIMFTLTILVLVFGVATCLKTQAGTGENGAGWLWGGGAENENPAVEPWDGTNTNVRWISMNSTNCDTNGNGSIDAADAAPVGCPPIGTVVPSYGVNIPSASCVDPNCNVTGYAWSGGDDAGPGLGYINFDPAGPYPAAPAYSVKRVGDTLDGWARFEEIRIAGGNSGGWSGWIKIRGTATNGSPYGVEVSKMDGTGNNPTYAWSDELGWIDFSKATLVTPSTLKICRDSCDSASKIDNGSTVTMTPGGTANLKACFNPDAGCGTATGDVTADAATVWTANNTPNDAVSLSGTNPKTLTANSEGSEGISATYNSQTSGFTATVVLPCICNTGCEASTCVGTNCNDSCGNSSCEGEKNCNANWKEVAP